MIEILKADFVDYYFLFEDSVFWDPKDCSCCESWSTLFCLAKIAVALMLYFYWPLKRYVMALAAS